MIGQFLLVAAVGKKAINRHKRLDIALKGIRITIAVFSALSVIGTE